MVLALGLAVASACLHASWNAIAHRAGASSKLVYRLPLVVVVAGIVPVTLAEIRDPMLTARVVGLLLVSGIAQAIYYFALRRAYASSDFAIAYPLARAMPVLFLTIFDATRAHAASALTFGGIALVGAGCMISPLKSFKDFTLEAYATKATLWTALVALGTLVCTISDKLALEGLPQRMGIVMRYSVWEALAVSPFVTILGARIPGKATEGVGWSIIAATFSFGSWALVLAAFQLTDHTSIIAALRQLSIPIGVALSTVFLREPATGMRWTAAAAIAVGLVCVVAGA
jgi:uncharacterized membrane protein